MQTVNDIKFDTSLFSDVNHCVLLLYEMDKVPIVIPLPSVQLVTFIHPFDNISLCQEYIATNDGKTFTLFAYGENMTTWLKNKNVIPDNVTEIILFCAFPDDRDYLKIWTKRYTQKITNIITYNQLELEVLIFGLKYIADLYNQFQENASKLRLLKEDYEKLRLALINYFGKQSV